MSPLYDRLGTVCGLLLVAMTVACISGDIDSLFSVNAPRPMDRFRISAHIRDSQLWKAYLEHLSRVRAGDGPVIAIDVQFDREVTEGESSGDYDAGVVCADFELTELRTRTTLLTDRLELEIPNHVVVAQDATRDEVQDAAFVEVEKKAVRAIISALDLAVVRAMGGEASRGAGFIPVLEDIHENHPSPELATEARIALDAIRSSSSSGATK